jgi:hypothetical protein
VVVLASIFNAQTVLAMRISGTVQSGVGALAVPLADTRVDVY